MSQDKRNIELETQSSSESPSPSMGQSGELIDFGSSYDDIQLARTADEAHERLAAEGKSSGKKHQPLPLKNGGLAAEHDTAHSNSKEEPKTQSERDMSPPPSPTEIYVHTRRDTAVELAGTPEDTAPTKAAVPPLGTGRSEADIATVTASQLLSASAPAGSSREDEGAEAPKVIIEETAGMPIGQVSQSQEIDTASPHHDSDIKDNGPGVQHAPSSPPNLLDPDNDADLKAYICHHGVRSPHPEPGTPAEHELSTSVPVIASVAVAVVSPEFDFPPDSEAVSVQDRAADVTITHTVVGAGATAGAGENAVNGTDNTEEAVDGGDNKEIPITDAAGHGTSIVAPPTPVSVHEVTITELTVTEVTVEEVVTVLGEAAVPDKPASTDDETVSSSALLEKPVVSDKATAPPVPPTPTTLKTKTKLRVRGMDMWWDGKAAHRAGIASVFAAMAAAMYQCSIKCTSPAPIYAGAWFAVAALNVLQPGPHLRTAQDWIDVVLDTTTKIVAAAVIKTFL